MVIQKKELAQSRVMTHSRLSHDRLAHLPTLNLHQSLAGTASVATT